MHFEGHLQCVAIALFPERVLFAFAPAVAVAVAVAASLHAMAPRAMDETQNTWKNRPKIRFL